MRELTFQGFLQKYMRDLSEQNTLNLFKLTSEAASKNPRMREPLLLYALLADKSDLLLRAAKDKKLHAEYADVMNRFDKRQMVSALQSQSRKLSPEYLKVWKSYLTEKNRTVTDNRTKELMWNKISRLQNEKRVTNYRLYTDLKLNPGNLNAYLKHGDSSKLGLDTTRKVLQYLENG